ncbi:MAG: AMP-binding protein [Candidatus Carbobacillus sp.]|nr:AMP-binding protein [Candidatus Carbobacillus sp.]
MEDDLSRYYRLPKGSHQELQRLFQWKYPEYFNLCADTVERQALLHPNRLALIEPNERRITYSELADLSSRLSSALQARSVKKGMVVAVWGDPGLELALAHLSLYRLHRREKFSVQN